jgi:hypothetical protein
MVATTYTSTRGRPVHAARPVSAWQKRWAARAQWWRYTGRRMAYRGGRAAGRTAGRVWTRLAPASLSMLGLGSLTGAAFQFGTVAGLVVLGLSAFVLEWRVSR